MVMNMQKTKNAILQVANPAARPIPSAGDLSAQPRDLPSLPDEVDCKVSTQSLLQMKIQKQLSIADFDKPAFSNKPHGGSDDDDNQEYGPTALLGGCTGDKKEQEKKMLQIIESFVKDQDLTYYVGTTTNKVKQGHTFQALKLNQSATVNIGHTKDIDQNSDHIQAACATVLQLIAAKKGATGDELSKAYHETDRISAFRTLIMAQDQKTAIATLGLRATNWFQDHMIKDSEDRFNVQKFFQSNKNLDKTSLESSAMALFTEKAAEAWLKEKPDEGAQPDDNNGERVADPLAKQKQLSKRCQPEAFFNTYGSLKTPQTEAQVNAIFVAKAIYRWIADRKAVQRDSHGKPKRHVDGANRFNVDKFLEQYTQFREQSSEITKIFLNFEVTVPRGKSVQNNVVAEKVKDVFSQKKGGCSVM